MYDYISFNGCKIVSCENKAIQTIKEEAIDKISKLEAIIDNEIKYSSYGTLDFERIERIQKYIIEFKNNIKKA